MAYCDLTTGVCPECNEAGEPHWLRNCSKTFSLRSVRPQGPGTQLYDLFQALGVNPKYSRCKCIQRMNQMNRWGAVGCREHFEKIVGWVDEEYKTITWTELLDVTAHLLATRLVFSINPIHPLRSLVDLAITLDERSVLERAGSLSTIPQSVG